MNGAGVLAAFAAGLLSFLSPCVLPLIPAYLSLVSGYGVSELKAGRGRFRVFLRTLSFTAGFSVAFTAMGLLFSGASMLLGGLSRSITAAAGILVIVLGLNMVFGFLKILDRDARFHPDGSPRGYAGSFLVGLAFAAGWSPCVGPMLASILLLAADGGQTPRAVLLLVSFSLGLAAPFLAASLFLERLSPLFGWLKRRARALQIASGILLVVLGAAMALGKLSFFSSLG